MDCWVQQGEVIEVVADINSKQELLVLIDNKHQQAINFPPLTGRCVEGDQVILNTTAVSLGLGTGGFHFVMGIVGRTHQPPDKTGHIIKLRYTPSQGRVLSVEEPDSPFHEILACQSSIGGMPVLVGSLHSMLAPVCIGFKYLAPQRKIAYIMSDGAALPLALSDTVQILLGHGLLDDTITFNHAFGGNYEAVNVYSALLTARHVCHADAAVILMGPGVVGTGTTWGTTALEQGIYLNAAHTLEGYPIGIVRLSMAEKRTRHQGISHHTLTALTKICERPCTLAFPSDLQDWQLLQAQLKALQHHHILWINTKAYRHLLEDCPVKLSSMGRDYSSDPYFFESALAAGLLAADYCNADTTVPEC
ncbi:MAG TPA: DUF3866 family protein [Firmicutes bacterium]|nr:DUF3866 family protein [Bacillota bacterium]